MRELLHKKIKSKKFLIAAHRGTFGANVIDNTYLSMKLATELGADIVEVDVTKSKDGILYAFHSGKELVRFGKDINLTNLLSCEIDKLEYLNLEGGKSGRTVERLETILSKLKGETLINIDRAWDNFTDVFSLCKKLGVEKQVIFKAREEDDVIDIFKKEKTKFMFMPIIRNSTSIYKYIDKEINTVAVEVLFDDEKSKLNSKEFKDFLKENDILLWVNSIKLDNTKKYNFAAGHYDDDALINNGSSWKWIIDNGANIIQTDWPYFLSKFRKLLEEK